MSCIHTYRRTLVVQKSKILEILGWSINWEIIHNKVKGIQLNGNFLEAVYKSKRSGVSMSMLSMKGITHYLHTSYITHNMLSGWVAIAIDIAVYIYIYMYTV